LRFEKIRRIETRSLKSGGIILFARENIKNEASADFQRGPPIAGIGDW
jgi:hypothetical protein